MGKKKSLRFYIILVKQKYRKEKKSMIDTTSLSSQLLWFWTDCNNFISWKILIRLAMEKCCIFNVDL